MQDKELLELSGTVETIIFRNDDNGYTVIAVNGYTNFPHADLIFCNYDNNSNYVGVITISSRTITEQATIEFICRKN